MFELRYLTGLPCDTLEGVKQAVARLQARGPRTVLVTSLRTEDTPDGRHRHAGRRGRRLAPPAHAACCRSPSTARATHSPPCSCFTVCGPATPRAALEAAGSAIHGLLRRTAEAGSREILLVDAAGGIREALATVSGRGGLARGENSGHLRPRHRDPRARPADRGLAGGRQPHRRRASVPRPAAVRPGDPDAGALGDHAPG